MERYRKYFGLVMLVVLVASAFLATPKRVQAATTIVVKPFDEKNANGGSICSLREAIISANTNESHGGCPAGSGADDVIYLERGQHVLRLSDTTDPSKADEDGNLGDLDIKDGVTITGAGPATEVLAEFTAKRDRIFHVQTKSKVMISNMTLKYGDATTSPGGGGGAILNDSGSDLSLYGLTITGNTAGTSGQGGGVTNKPYAKLTIGASTISGNFAFFGGGIYNAGTLTVDNSLISSNTAYSTGGGLDNNAGSLENNTQDNLGATVNNSTVTKNIGLVEGGGISNSGKLTLKYDTIINNDKDGVRLKYNPSVSFQNTIIAGHGSNNCVSKSDDTVTFNNEGYNLTDNTIDNNPCGLSADPTKHNQFGVAVKLVFVLDSSESPLLGNNGGPTQTYRLSETSLAIDAIPTSEGSCTGAADQRRYPRGGDGADADSVPGCDIGAFEDGASPELLYIPLISHY